MFVLALSNINIVWQKSLSAPLRYIEIGLQRGGKCPVNFQKLSKDSWKVSSNLPEIFSFFVNQPRN